MSTAAIIGGTAAAGLGSAFISSNAAGDAASTQANAATNAAGLQYQSGQNSLAFQTYVYQQQLANQYPWLRAGQGSVNSLANLVGVPGYGPGGTMPSQPAIPQNVGQPSGQPSSPAGPQSVPGLPQQTDPLAQYQGKSFDQLVNSGDPNISPNAQTTQQWMAQGIPFQNVTTPDGRTVAVRSNPLNGGVPTFGPGGVSFGGAQPATPQASNAFASPQIGRALRPDDSGLPTDPWTGQPISGIPANPYYPQNPTPQSPSGLPNYSGLPASTTVPAQSGGLGDAHSGNMGQPVFKGGQWINPQTGQPVDPNTLQPSAGQPGAGQAPQAPGQPQSGPPGVPDVSSTGSLTQPWQYQFNAPQPFGAQPFQGTPGFQPPNAFAAPAPYSGTPFQGSPSFQPPPSFQAPDSVTEQNDPGYKFRLQQGLDAVQASAAARGDLLTGGTAKAVNDYAQNYASGEYQNVFNRGLTQQQNNYGQGLATNQNAFNQAYGTSQLGFGQGLSQNQNAFTQGLTGQQNQFGQALSTNQNAFNQALSGQSQNFNQNLAGYQTNYQNALTNYQQAYNQFQQGQGNAFNRYAALAGVGQTAAGNLNSAGSAAAGNVAGILGSTASGIGQQLNNAAAAQASGIVGGANAFSGALSGGTNSLAQLLLFKNLFGGGGANPGGQSAIATYPGAFGG